MNLRNHIEYSATTALLGLCRILPEEAVYGLFKGFSLLLFSLSKNRRKLSLRNIQIAFPEKSSTERYTIARKAFINLSESLAFNALVMCGRISNEQMLACVEADDWEKLEKVIRESTRGTQFISAHLGNWELLVQYCSFRLTRPLHAIARQSNNPLLEERIVLPLRERFGMEVIYKKNAVLRLVRLLRKNHTIGLMLDQRLNPPQGIVADFFGKAAGTTPTAALLQIRLDPVTVPLFMVHTGQRKYRLILGDPIEWTDNGKPQDEQVQELTRIQQNVLADIIRQYPEQWFWMHNRWSLKKDEL